MAEQQFTIEGYHVHLAPKTEVLWQQGSTFEAVGSIEVYGEQTRLLLYFVEAKEALGKGVYLPDKKIATSFVKAELWTHYLSLLDSAKGKQLFAYVNSEAPERNGLFMTCAWQEAAR